MGTTCDDYKNGDLSIDVDDAEQARIVCTWRGRSVDRDPGLALNPYFGRLLDVALERQASLEMRFDALDHFNSSTIASLIRFIQSARSRGVRLVVRYDPSLKWQRLSFEALRVLDKNDQLFQLEAV